MLAGLAALAGHALESNVELRSGVGLGNFDIDPSRPCKVEQICPKRFDKEDNGANRKVWEPRVWATLSCPQIDQNSIQEPSKTQSTSYLIFGTLLDRLREV